MLVRDFNTKFYLLTNTFDAVRIWSQTICCNDDWFRCDENSKHSLISMRSKKKQNQLIRIHCFYLHLLIRNRIIFPQKPTSLIELFFGLFSQTVLRINSKPYASEWFVFPFARNTETLLTLTIKAAVITKCSYNNLN